ncbi:hypothetical protein [Modestobacter sp. DSM 44400]|uniref:hypothetical protein n=1 Tax=Modestobacter sp. DSM 44400 TaxID=1550230 RepID=UPI00352AD9FB
MGVAPTRSADIGDAPTDLLAATRSGAHALTAGWGHLYDPTAPAEHTVDRPGDLVDLLVDQRR